MTLLAAVLSIFRKTTVQSSPKSLRSAFEVHARAFLTRSYRHQTAEPGARANARDWVVSAFPISLAARGSALTFGKLDENAWGTYRLARLNTHRSIFLWAHPDGVEKLKRGFQF